MTITPADASVLIPRPLDTRDIWCAYEHWMNLSDDPTAPPSIIYVAACKLNDVFTFGTAKQNSEWAALTTDNTRPIMVRVVALGDRTEMFNHAVQHMHRFDPVPRCNLYGTSAIMRPRREILCSNGKTYATQLEAARDLGITQGAISSVLSGKSKTAKGHTFARKEL